jgi:hypothetical protein
MPSSLQLYPIFNFVIRVVSTGYAPASKFHYPIRLPGERIAPITINWLIASFVS